MATQVTRGTSSEDLVDLSEASSQQEPAGRSVWYIALLAIVVIAGAAFRLWQIDRIGFGGDEAVYSGQAAVLAGHDWASRYFLLISRGNSNFLLYQSIVALAYAIWGVSDIAARLVSVAFSVATIVVVYRIGATVYDRTVGLIGAALLAISGYAVLLGRLALLDAAMTFFFTLAVMCAARWILSERPAWFYGFAAVAALAIQAKVTAGIVIVAVLLYMLVTRRVYGLTLARVAIGAAVFVAFLAPAVYQVFVHRAEFFNLLGESSERSSAVNWDYYISTLTRYEGYVLPVIWLAGLLVALVRRTKLDLLFALAAVLIVGFYQLYPLKAYNYLLPAIPTVCVLGGRALVDAARALLQLSRGRADRRRRATPVFAGIVIALVGVLVVGASARSVDAVVNSTQNAGLREAAAWLAANTPADASVMTLSQGSGQYVFSFYARRDSYPFGRFRLATVLPGGTVVHPEPTTPGDPPKDWISQWPPLLLGDRTVDYLVYYTQSGDDPPETPLVNSQNQRDFKSTIEHYGGELVHAEYYNHEGRVFIYDVRRLRAHPKLTASVEAPSAGSAASASTILLEGEGFDMGSTVTIYVHQAAQQTVVADDDGAFSATVTVDQPLEEKFWIVAVDESGRDASVTGDEVDSA